MECNTDTVNTLADCIIASRGLGGAAPPEGAIQYNEGGALAGSSLITYNDPSQGLENLVLDTYGLGAVLNQPRSTYISGRDVNVHVASGVTGGRLNINTVNSGSGGDVAVGEGFNISNNVPQLNTQTISHGLPAGGLSTIKSTLDFVTPDRNRLAFFEDGATAIGYTKAGRPNHPQLLPSATLTEVIDAFNNLLKSLAIYGLITTS
jgi:hypothetical protein